MGTKRPEGSGDVLLWLSGSDMTVSCTAFLPYWPQAFSAVLCGLWKLIIGCLTQTASEDLPTMLEQEDNKVQPKIQIRRERAVERWITLNVLN